MDEIDFWRAAQQLIKMYGLDAELAATRRRDKAIDQGDTEGEQIWERITQAVIELQRQIPFSDEQLN